MRKPFAEALEFAELTEEEYLKGKELMKKYPGIYSWNATLQCNRAWKEYIPGIFVYFQREKCLLLLFYHNLNMIHGIKQNLLRLFQSFSLREACHS